MEAMEAILVGDIIFGIIVAVMHIRMERKYGTDYRIINTGNPFDYLFKPMPEGTFTVHQPFLKAFAWYGAIVVITGSGWIAVNVPQWTALGLIYLSMGIIAMVVWLAEEIAPFKSRITAAMAAGYGEWDEQLIAGILIATPFILVGLAGQIYNLQVERLQIEGMPVASFIVTVIIAPAAEEGLFRGVIAPSVAEDAGVVHGALASAFIFAVFHAYAYHLRLPSMLVVFLFGVVASIVDFKYKSVIPGGVAHHLINAFAFISS